MFFYPTTNPCTQPRKAVHDSGWWAVSIPHMLKHISVPHDVVTIDLGEDPPFFSCLFSVLWHALTLPCIAHFSARLPHSRDSWCPMYPSLASTCSPGSKNDTKLCWIFWYLWTYPRGRDPGSTPGSPLQYSRPAYTIGQISLHICGTRMHSLLSLSPFGGHRSQSHGLS